MLNYFSNIYPWNIKMERACFFRDRLFLEQALNLIIEENAEDAYTQFEIAAEALGRWVKDMEKEHEDYELEDAQLIYNPSGPLSTDVPKIKAKIILIKKDLNEKV